jgi:hypothetical protein
MKRMKTAKILVLIAVLATTIGFSSAAFAAGSSTSTAAAQGLFPSGTVYNGVNLSSSEFGLGVSIPGDGTASGDYQTVLLGTSLLGQAQNIAIVATASSGSVNADGTVTFSGSAIVDMGDGSAPASLPFTVTLSTTALTLVLGTTTLATQTLSLGTITL